MLFVQNLAATFYRKFLALPHQAKGFLAAVLAAWWIFPGFSISLLALTGFIFRKDLAESWQHLSIWNSEGLKELLRRRKPEIKKALQVILVGALGFNFIGLVLGSFLSVRGFGDSMVYHRFFLGLRTVQVSVSGRILYRPEGVESLGISSANLALMEVCAGDDPGREFYGSYDYSEWFADDPVYVRYAFYDLDFFPDLVLDTNQQDYYVSGFSGEVKRKYFWSDLFGRGG